MDFEKGFDAELKRDVVKSVGLDDVISYERVSRENIIKYFDNIFEKHVGEITDTMSYSLYFYESDDYNCGGISGVMYIEKMETEEERLVRYEKWLKNKEKRVAKQAKRKEEKLLKEQKQKEEFEKMQAIERQKRYEEFLKLKEEFGE